MKFQLSRVKALKVIILEQCSVMTQYGAEVDFREKWFNGVSQSLATGLEAYKLELVVKITSMPFFGQNHDSVYFHPKMQILTGAARQGHVSS